MVTTSLQLGKMATHLTGSKLSSNLGLLTVSFLLPSDSGSEACVLGCRGGGLLLAVVGPGGGGGGG